MKNTSSTPLSGWFSALRKAVAVVALTGVSMGVALAAPLAGTTIGNQAAATYTDASLIGRTATSNTVTTIVQQVAAFTLTASQTKTSSPGSPVSFPHTITNLGNGVDSFNLTAVATGGAFVLGTPQYFIDANCDGVADNATPITAVTNVAAGASACFVMTGIVPATATSGQVGTGAIVAASGLTPAITQTNTDTINVTAQAVINVTKSVSLPSGPAGTTPVTYTLTYTNTGNTAATQFILADFLPANVTYVGSPMLNGAAITPSATALVLPVATPSFDFGVTVAGRVTAVIPSVAAGQSGTLSFTVTMGSAVAPITPTGIINNNANYCYNDGAAQQPATCTLANVATAGATPTTQSTGVGTPTNTATFTILQTAGVAANELAGTTGAAITTAGTTDTVTVASATQGQIVVFNDHVHNNGNGIDTFNITLSAGNFPAGTTFLLFKSDGVTPLTDTNAIPDGIVDTGPLAAGADYIVVVHAVLPSGAVAAVNGPYSNVLTARSTFNPTGLIGVGFDTVNNVLTTIVPNTVDLTTGFGVVNTVAPTATVGAQGLGAGPSLASVTGGNLTNPGGTVTYPLYINNTSTIADTYALSNSALPAGWSVTYFADGGAGNCSTLGATVTNTGVIAGEVAATLPATGFTVANKVVCAVVTTAASGPTAAPGSSNITFTVTSPTTGASDTKLETVTINTVRALTLTPPNAGQVFPGGSVVYSHMLVNSGNVTEGTGAVGGSTITLTDPMSGATLGWNNIVYWDTNNNGTLDAADVVVATTLNAVASATTLTTDGVAVGVGGGLLPGKTIRLFVKVLAPASAAAGDIDTSSLTATVTGLINTVAAPAAVVAADTTTVIVGQVLLTKTQALDALCDGVADTAFSNAPINTGAIPGSCVMYQITAQNVGTAPVTSVVVSDATPANTTYIDYSVAVMPIAAPVLPALTHPATTTVGTITAPLTGAAGTIQATVGTLAPTASALISFAVRINP